MSASATRLVRVQFGVGLILLLSSFLSLASTNSAWFTRAWQIDDGLLDNNVSSVVQGPDDYLWLATPIGLMRFDGENFSQFPLENFTSLAPVRAMFCSSSDALWMAFDSGTVIGLKPDFSKTVFSGDLPHCVLWTLAEGKDGSLWLGYPNGTIYHVHNGKLSTLKGLPSGLLHSLQSDNAGNIWVAVGNQIGIFRNERFCQIATVPGLEQLAATHTNAVWFTTGTHLFTCDIDGVLRDYGSFQNEYRPGDGITRLLQDRAGGVWIGTRGNGLFYYNKSNFERIETSHSSILSLAEDREGNIWVGTSGGGLDRISLCGARLEPLEYNQSRSQMQSICEDSQGVLWGSARNGNLVSRKGDGWQPALTNTPFAGIVTCVAADRTAVWISTWNHQLFRLINTNYTVWETNVTQEKVAGLLPASNGDLWIVGNNTLQCLRGRQLRDVKLPRQVKKIYSIAEDTAGDIWIGANGILVRFKEKEFAYETLPLHMSDRPICCLYGTTDGSLWIGSRGGGLMRLKDGIISQIGVKQGLYDSYISQIIADGHGWIWFGANHGIFKIKQRELEQAMEDKKIVLHPIIYGKNEGLASQEAISSASEPSIFPRAILDSDGCVRILVHDGVVVGDPKILPENSPPSAILTGVVVDGKTIASYGGIAETQMIANLQELKAPLRLPPAHRHLEFDFTSIRFGEPENIYFRYQLVGFDNDWVDAGTRRSADYTRLTAGHYEFHVEACIGEGPWSEMPATLALTVDPFFWQTWWFCLGVLLVFAFSLITIVRYVSIRRIQAQMRLLEERAALDRERTRIARDLHDDLGGSLSLAALTLEMTQREPKDWELMNEKILRCTTLVRRAALSVDEIVWAINPHNDTLRYLVDYFSQFAVELLHSADILCLVELPDDIPNQRISPEVRNNLWLVVKETLNNITRHAHASEVYLRVAVSENQLAISIKDNGCGFESPPENASCDGLRNMRQRMGEIGGQFRVDSRSGAGTHIMLLYPLPYKI